MITAINLFSKLVNNKLTILIAFYMSHNTSLMKKLLLSWII